MALSYDQLLQLLRDNRSTRRFRHDIPVGADALRRFADATRYCASGRNLQPLKYILVDDPQLVDRIFPTLQWAGYLTDWEGPAPDERPTAYAVQLIDTSLAESILCDDGLQLEAFTLAARAEGISSCIIKSFNIPRLSEILSIPAHLKPHYVVALGVAAEEIRLEKIKDGDFKYWRSEDGVHHVPKRPLDEIIVGDK